MLEGGYGRKEFRIGAVRLTLAFHQHQAMKRMHGQAMTTATRLADDLDSLSDFLGAQEQVQVDAITTRLAEIGVLPERFRDVVSIAREAIELYSDLLEDIGEREKFEAEDVDE